MAGGRPRKFNSVKEIDDCVNEYKKYLTTNNKPPTMAGLAYYLDIDRKTLYNYAAKDEYFHTIKKYRDWIEMNLEEMSIDKGGGGTIFLLKNYGYTDKQEVVNTIVNNPIDEMIAELKK